MIEGVLKKTCRAGLYLLDCKLSVAQASMCPKTFASIFISIPLRFANLRNIEFLNISSKNGYQQFISTKKNSQVRSEYLCVYETILHL